MRRCPAVLEQWYNKVKVHQAAVTQDASGTERTGRHTLRNVVLLIASEKTLLKN